MYSTGDPVFDLVAAIHRQAVSDAMKGDPEAAAWLDMCCPDWRRLVRPQLDEKSVSGQRAAKVEKFTKLKRDDKCAQVFAPMIG